MFKKQNVLVLVAVVLAIIYVYHFTDWINRPTIQIMYQTRPVPPRNPRAQVLPISFLLDGQYALSSVKVVPVDAYETNKHTAPMWHLTADAKVELVQGFLYGQRLRGMKPWMTNAAPKQLQPDTTYRLFVEAGRARGQIDFRASAGR